MLDSVKTRYWMDFLSAFRSVLRYNCREGELTYKEVYASALMLETVIYMEIETLNWLLYSERNLWQTGTYR